MGDITNPRLLYLKGLLFLILGLLCAGLLIARAPELETVVLLAVAIWGFARAYYFAFYVVEHYVDGRYRFAGLSSFALYVWRGAPLPEEERPGRSQPPGTDAD